MININFLFPWEKRRIKDEIAKKIMDKYNKKVVGPALRILNKILFNERVERTTSLVLLTKL